VVMLHNCGSGPATDIRANVCRPGEDASGPPAIVFDVALPGGRSHLGPKDGELRLQAEERSEPIPGREGGEITSADKRDVWIIHCADLYGSHWHGWCNWSRDNTYRPGEPFMFESAERTPPWIVENCERCQELEEMTRTQAESS